ncbi:MAG: hypothetical protein GF311_17595 [Candidatus Lokiarchaeota archaeon]|jgi:hypothetical protein|nr:hypothetical protein [Candidatus Lokiarchaeota archaeon]
MKSKFIEDYQFGRIEINNKTYTNDVILLGKEVLPEWWRERGHSLAKKDLEKVIDYNPDVLIVGTGNSGRMTVPRDLPKKLNLKVKSYPTKTAVKEYNKRLENGKKIAGAFHLTC